MGALQEPRTDQTSRERLVTFHVFTTLLSALRLEGTLIRADAEPLENRNTEPKTKVIFTCVLESAGLREALFQPYCLLV